jgi:Fur family ferric uptake transcriptional regulator
MVPVQLQPVEVSQSPEDKFREYLASRPRPMRFTEPQRQLVRFIFSQHSHFDADQLADDAKRQGIASRATVYRTLDKLVAAELLRQLSVGPRRYYEHDYGYPQHDHLVCESCKKIIEFQHPGMETVIREVSQQNQFKVTGHSFVLRGICPECNQARVTKRRLDLV